MTANMDAYKPRSYFFFCKLSQAPSFSDSTMIHNMGYKFHKTLVRTLEKLKTAYICEALPVRHTKKVKFNFPAQILRLK